MCVCVCVCVPCPRPMMIRQTMKTMNSFGNTMTQFGTTTQTKPV